MEDLLSLMVREHRHIPFVIRIIPKRYFHYLLARALRLAAALALPVALTAWNLGDP
jgi:hypothetical protein